MFAGWGKLILSASLAAWVFTVESLGEAGFWAVGVSASGSLFTDQLHASRPMAVVARIVKMRD